MSFTHDRRAIDNYLFNKRLASMQESSEPLSIQVLRKTIKVFIFSKEVSHREIDIKYEYVGENTILIRIKRGDFMKFINMSKSSQIDIHVYNVHNKLVRTEVLNLRCD